MYQELSIATHTGGSSKATLHSMQPLIDVHIVNSFDTMAAFYSHLDSLRLLDPDRIRPRWDTYFMVCFILVFCQIFVTYRNRGWLPWPLFAQTV